MSNEILDYHVCLAGVIEGEAGFFQQLLCFIQR